MFIDEISIIKTVYKIHVSIYKRENAINTEVQPKVLLIVFLGL